MPGRPGLSRQPLIVLKPHLLAERAELVVGAVEAVMISQFHTVFSWDPDFHDPHDKCERKPDHESNRGHRLEIAPVFPRATGKKSAKVGAVTVGQSTTFA